ncbi:flavin reductase family protein [Kitasatospora cineracea]|uniref:flavin reductase family protein n=1 Tax=Kitasatospora cineracea TaxID=88074 RepID=UPI00382354EE
MRDPRTTAQDQAQPPDQAPAGPAPARPAVGPDALRAAARHWPTGVAVLSARWGGEEHAKTVSSFTTLSLDPPLIGVALSPRSPLAAAVHASGRFAVTVLTDRQEPLARRFAAPGAGRSTGAFSDLPVRAEPAGAPVGGPVPAGAAAWFAAELHAEVPVGDHVLLVGRVTAAGADGGRPLLHHAARYRLLGPETPPTVPTPFPTRGVGA